MRRSASYTPLLILVAVLGPVGCSRSIGAGGDNAAERLRVAILPDRKPAEIRERYAPLLAYLSEHVGIQCEQVAVESYAHLLELFHDGRVDLAHFGGLTFLKAHERDRAIPLVSRDADLRFTSYFLVRGDNPAKRLEDCRGMSFSFGSQLSTSGHLMPRFFMRELNVRPEAYFSEVRYSGAHDETAFQVRDGTIDIGVANACVIDSMYEDGRLDRARVRVLSESPPYPDYVWAVHPQLDSNLRNRLRNAFLMLSSDDARHAEILDGLEARSFFPTGVRDFQKLRGIALSMGLLGRS